MSSTGTRKERNVQTRSNEAITEADKEFINGLKLFSESSNSVAGLTGASVNNSPKTPAGNYLAREGDSMIGPLALGPPLDFSIDVDTNNTIDIGPLNENFQYTSNVQLDDLQPNSSVLDVIANAAFDGQILVLRTFAPTVPYTISHATLLNGGNIQTGDSNDLIVGDLQSVTLIFDESLIVHANTGGTWRVMSTSSGIAGGEFFGPWTANHDAGNFALNNVSAIQISDPVGGVHGLIQGLAATGVRLTLTTSEVYQIFDNITQIFQVDATGVNLFGNNLGMGVGGNIIGGGAGEGMTSIGHLDFINNSATPIAAISLYSDGIDLFANTGGGVVNISNLLSSLTPWTTNIDAADFALNDVSSIQISDTSSNIHGIIQGLIGTGVRHTITSGETLQIYDNINSMVDISTSAGVVLNNIDLTMGTGAIVAGGATVQINNVGEVAFVNNTLTPGGNGIFFFDGTDLKAKTGSTTVNLTHIGGANFTDAVFRVTDELDLTKKFAVDVGTSTTGVTTTLLFGSSANRTISFPNATTTLAGLNTTHTWTGVNTFAATIVAGGAGFGMSSIGQLDFVNNLATPVAAVSLYSDGTDLIANTGGGAGNVFITPAVELLDMSNFDIQNLNNIDFGGAHAGSGRIRLPNTAGAIRWESSPATAFEAEINFISSELTFTAAAGDTFGFWLGDAVKSKTIEITSSGIDLQGGALTNGNIDTGMITSGILPVNRGGTANGASTQGDILYAVVSNAWTRLPRGTAGQVLTMNVGATVPEWADAGGSDTPWTEDHDANSNSLINIDVLEFINGAQPQVSTNAEQWFDDADMHWNVPSGDGFVWTIAGSSFQKLNLDTATANFSVDINMNQNYIQFDGMTDPTTVVGEPLLFADASNLNHLSIISGDGGTLIDLEAGASLTPWASNIDADGFDLNDLSNIEFRDTTGAPGNTLRAIWADSVNMRFNVPTADGFVWSINGVSEFGIGVSTINFNSNRGINVLDPTGDQDAATKKYVDDNTGSDGNQDFYPWLVHESTQYDEIVAITNSKTGSSATTSGSYSEDTIYYVPIFISERSRIVELYVHILGGFAGSYTISMGIYNNRTDGQNYPAGVIVQNTLLAADSLVKTVTVTDTNLEPGLYWLAFACTTDDMNLRFHVEGDCNSVGYRKNGTTSMQPITGFVNLQTSSTLPTTAANDMTLATSLANSVPALYAKLIANTS